jgi:hypothetical protein
MPWGCLNDGLGWFLCVQHDREEDIHPVCDGAENVLTKLISQVKLRANICDAPCLPVSARRHASLLED